VIRRLLVLYFLICATVLAAAQVGQIPDWPPRTIVIPLGTPQSLGVSGDVNNAASTRTMTTTANIGAGDLAGFCLLLNNGSATVSSLSDGTNSYAKATSAINGTTKELGLWYKDNASAVGSGATVTATFNVGASGAPIVWTMIGWHVSGVAVSPLDQIASNFTSMSSSSLSSTTPSLSQANEIVAGCTAQVVSGTSYNGSAGFSNIDHVAPGSSLANADYKIVASTAASTYANNYSSSSTLFNAQATFKGH